MVKTCMNCKSYHASLEDNENGFFHIHDWCEQWKTVLYPFALADKNGYECPFNNDFETGEACCYMFEAVEEPVYPDEWFEKNREENRRQSHK